MPLVVDASVAACWAFRDEDHPIADLALEMLRHEQAAAPGLWWFEIRNILVVNERRGRLSPADSATFLGHVSLLKVELDRTPNEGEVLRLARTHRLSVYHAAYLELAQRLGCPLATLDGELIRAAKAERVDLVEG